MKTTKMISALSIALFFFAVTTAFSAGIGGKGDGVSNNRMVNHHVNVILTLDKVLCNTYQVEILNGKGQLVAPPKRYIPGTSGYDFYERGPVDGVRIAVLVLAPAHSHFQCEVELFTAPAMLKGIFDAGQTYRYDLFPQTQQNKE